MNTSSYLYNDYVKRISEGFESIFSTIQAVHNFEYGDEFESTLATALDRSLPSSYGITKGYVVDALGNVAGDDLIICDKSRFPTLHLRDLAAIHRKEFIPIEAVYSYIEAKHTICLEGEGGQSLIKAYQQVADVKRLCSTRLKRDPRKLSEYVTFQSGIEVIPSDGMPSIVNPSHGAIFARQVRLKEGGPLLKESVDIVNALKDYELPEDPGPDFMVLGDSVLIIPTVPTGEAGDIRFPFFVEGTSRYQIVVAEGLGFGLGLIWLQYALDMIKLDVMPWRKIIGDALGILVKHKDLQDGE